MKGRARFIMAVSGYSRQLPIFGYLFWLKNSCMLIMFLSAVMMVVWTAPALAGPDSGGSRDQKKYSYQEKKQLKNKAKTYKSMSPDKQKQLQQNMDRFNKLPPEKQKTYKKRYQQFHQLSPAEQNQIRKKLKKNHLSPREKEEIRKKFK